MDYTEKQAKNLEADGKRILWMSLVPFQINPPYHLLFF